MGPSTMIGRRLRLLREAVTQGREFTADWWRYVRYATPTEGSVRPDDEACHLETQIAKDAHRVEKALAVREPRRNCR
ncbi:MAG TPA: hypothetical protein GXZ45_14870 [Propionibacterium sp.]|nr:hypothetical protein [Propionibacterium sp.]